MDLCLCDLIVWVVEDVTWSASDPVILHLVAGGWHYEGIEVCREPGKEAPGSVLHPFGDRRDLQVVVTVGVAN